MLLALCTEVEVYGRATESHRREMGNDLQESVSHATKKRLMSRTIMLSNRVISATRAAPPGIQVFCDSRRGGSPSQ